jgi:hypothetical protein
MKKKVTDKQFLKDSEHSGRFIVYYPETGKKYYIEPIGYHKTSWGDVNPASGKIEGAYGAKYKGSIDESESLITKENGFKTSYTVKGSPFAKIEELHNDYIKRLKK